MTLELYVGQALSAASRKCERLFCKSMRDAAPHQDQGSPTRAEHGAQLPEERKLTFKIFAILHCSDFSS